MSNDPRLLGVMIVAIALLPTSAIADAPSLAPSPPAGLQAIQLQQPTDLDAAEAVPPPALPETIEPAEISILERPVFVLTVDGAPSAEVTEGFAALSDEYSITDSSEERFGSWRAPVGDAAYAPPRFAPTAFHWAAPAVFSRPLYFEQPNLERYGHYPALCKADVLTPSAVSAAHFFATVPVLPYQLGAEPPDECNYVLGSYRPGSCNPHQLIRPKFSLRGLAYEAVAATGLVYLIP